MFKSSSSYKTDGIFNKLVHFKSWTQELLICKMKFLILQVLLVFAIGTAQSRVFPFLSKNKERNFEVLPNHKNYTLMARYIVHNSDWAAVAYRSQKKESYNSSLATIFSMADGPMSNGTGVPYFYLTELEDAVKDLVRNDSRCGLMMSLAQGNICAKNKWDPYDPRCARVYLNGRLERLKNQTSEHEFAKKAFTERHPSLIGSPGFHSFFYAKYVIQSINIISGFGGGKVVSLKDYYQANSK